MKKKKTGNKGHYFQAWFSLKVVPTFLVVLLTRDSAERFFIKVVTTRKLLISVAKVTQLWLGIVQHLARWPPFFIAYLQSTCLREHLFKIWEKSIWYFYHARATLTWLCFCRSIMIQPRSVFRWNIRQHRLYKKCLDNRNSMYWYKV